MADRIAKPGCINVLSIDGGGIRGIIPATILAAVERSVGRRLHEVFDLISGTSTGGIIAAAIGAGAKQGQAYEPSELVDLYVKNGPTIFRKNLLTPLRAVFMPKYSPKPLERVLQKFFGAAELRSAKTPLLISSYDLETQKPFFFKSHKIASDATYNWHLWRVARSTSAAPTYFPPFRLQGDKADYALVDGGIYVNNPAVAAYAEARNIYHDATEFLVVSAGTGDRPDAIAYRKAKTWGLLGWARLIVPVIMDSVSEAVDYELDTILGKANHYRLQPELTTASSEMDNVSSANLEQLQIEGQEFVQKNAEAIEQICALLKPGRGSDLPGIGEPVPPRPPRTGTSLDK
ncbi:MAG TPA: CBASS cGAMP-activated phospholipase [Terriglobales bacterium]|nr:CBASS cGAMP-activated phospholipase [Terriglobales bacterium]